MNKAAILISSGLILVGLACSARADQSKEDKKERTLTVQGQAKVSAVPDIATLSVEVSRDGADMDPVLAQVRQEMNKVLEAIKAQGIADKDVRTEFFQVHPKYEQDKRGNPRPVGYTVANQVSVKVRDLKKTGKVLTAVLKAGATRVDGPAFEIDNPRLLEREVLALATKEARAEAEAVAQAADVKLGEIITINPQNVNWPMPRRPLMMRAMAMSAAAPAEEPISAGEQTLTGYVTLTYAIH